VTLGKPSERLFLYRKWPKKLLNRLSEEKKERLLLKMVPNAATLERPFFLPQGIQHVSRVLYIWPEDPVRAYSCFPVITSLKKAWPTAGELHLAPPDVFSFLQTAFGKENVLPLQFSDLRLDDVDLAIVASRFRDFKAEVAFSMNSIVTPWRCLLLGLSAAPLRFQLGGAMPFPYANIQVANTPGEALFAMAQRLAPLLKGSGLLSHGLAWARLQASETASAEGLKFLNQNRLNVGNLWAYVPGPLGYLDTETAQSLRRQEGSIEIFSLELKEMPGTGQPPTFVRPEGSITSLLTVHTLSQLLGILSWVKGAFGPPSPLLYLLSLADLEIRTWLVSQNSDLDLSGFNTKFRLLPSQP